MLNFGQALDAVKQGKRAGRKGWNVTGMCIYLIPGGDFATQRDSEHYNPYLAVNTVEGAVCTWVPTIEDCLAEDWEVEE